MIDISLCPGGKGVFWSSVKWCSRPLYCYSLFRANLAILPRCRATPPEPTEDVAVLAALPKRHDLSDVPSGRGSGPQKATQFGPFERQRPCRRVSTRYVDSKILLMISFSFRFPTPPFSNSRPIHLGPSPSTGTAFPPRLGSMYR